MNNPQTPTLHPPLEMAAFDQIADGYKAACLLRAGFSSGLFDWLHKHGPTGKSALADSLGLRGAHLGAFLQALEDLGCLLQTDNLFRLSESTSALLSSESAWCYAPRLEALMADQSRWARLADFMTDERHHCTLSPGELCSAAGYRQHPMLEEARSILDHPATQEALQRSSSIICFDGCDGLTGAIIGNRYPDTPLTVVVPERVLHTANRFLESLAPQGKWTLLAGNLFDMPAEKPFDQLVLSHNLYALRKTTAAALVAAAALTAPGGGLIAAHWFCLEDCEAAPGALHDLDRAIITDSHPLCHIEHFCERLEQAGFVDCHREDQNGPYGSTKLHFGRKAE
ncbi:MAG: hypothetical protein ACK5NQ_13505 [Pseudomonas sp.]